MGFLSSSTPGFLHCSILFQGSEVDFQGVWKERERWCVPGVCDRPNSNHIFVRLIIDKPDNVVFAFLCDLLVRSFLFAVALWFRETEDRLAPKKMFVLCIFASRNIL